MKKEILVYGCLFVLLALLSVMNCEKTITKEVLVYPDTSYVEIGVLVDLRGDAAAAGEDILAALQIRTNDLNNQMESLDALTRLRLVVEDCATDPDSALTKLQSLHEQGIEMFIGPVTSESVASILEYANENEILILSPSSTAISLALPDYVFRFAPNDTKQSHAIASLMIEDGMKVLVSVNRDEIYGNELINATRSDFETLGGVLADSQVYSLDVDDYSALATDVNSAVATLLNSYTADQIAVLLVSFEEAEEILAAAGTYENLRAIHWYGSDGNAQLSSLITNSSVKEIATDMHFTAPTFGENEDSEIDDMVRIRVGMSTGHLSVSMDAVFAYDALNVLFLSYIRFTSQDRYSLVEIFPVYSQSQYGASGWGELDQNGDRVYSSYDFYSVLSTGWSRTASYHFSPASMEGQLIRY